MQLEPSFFKEEIRSDFLVTESMKKVWAVELELLGKFDEVCKKYDLTYYAYYGTLLGAVRHGGFIPWDNDVDLVMFRDDYEKLQAVAQEEFTEPYFFQNSYTDKLVWSFSKLRDSRTTAYEYPNSPDVNQGIFIDIFPLDDVPDGITPRLSSILEIQKIFWNLISNPREILFDLQQGKQLLLDIDVIADLIDMDRKQRFRAFENFNLSHFGQSQNVNYIVSEIANNSRTAVKREWFQKTEYFPFENMKIPVPAEYDKILTHYYGDYHQLIRGGSGHENIIFDPDIPYLDFFAQVSLS